MFGLCTGFSQALRPFSDGACLVRQLPVDASGFFNTTHRAILLRQQCYLAHSPHGGGEHLPRHDQHGHPPPSQKNEKQRQIQHSVINIRPGCIVLSVNFVWLERLRDPGTTHRLRCRE
jgi:hypothetical protein